MVTILNELGVEYSSFNILADQEVRQGRAKSEGEGELRVWRNSVAPSNRAVQCYFQLYCSATYTALKTYSNWPTYPQLYANGELVGGLDIVKVCNSGKI